MLSPGDSSLGRHLVAKNLTPLASKAFTVSADSRQVMSSAELSKMNLREQEDLRGMCRDLCAVALVSALLFHALRQQTTRPTTAARRCSNEPGSRCPCSTTGLRSGVWPNGDPPQGVGKASC